MSEKSQEFEWVLVLTSPWEGFVGQARNLAFLVMNSSPVLRDVFSVSFHYDMPRRYRYLGESLTIAHFFAYTEVSRLGEQLRAEILRTVTEGLLAGPY